MQTESVLVCAEIQDMECIGCAMRQRDRHGKDEGRAQRLEIRDGGKANSITTVNKDSMVMEYDTDQGSDEEGIRGDSHG